MSDTNVVNGRLRTASRLLMVMVFNCRGRVADRAEGTRYKSIRCLHRVPRGRASRHHFPEPRPGIATALGYFRCDRHDRQPRWITLQHKEPSWMPISAHRRAVRLSNDFAKTLQYGNGSLIISLYASSIAFIQNSRNKGWSNIEPKDVPFNSLDKLSNIIYMGLQF